MHLFGLREEEIGTEDKQKKGASKTGAAKASNPSFPLSLALLLLLLCSLFRFPVGLSTFIPLSFTLRLNVGLGMVVLELFSFLF